MEIRIFLRQEPVLRPVENCGSTVTEEKVSTMASWVLHPTVGVEFYLTVEGENLRGYPDE
jgi:hypothetical protein